MIKELHFGLVIVRAFAISIVLLIHSNIISQFIPYNLPSFITKIKIPDGIDLFFVISGFLIPSILLKIDWKKISSIIKFWKRRLLRTLPNYFLISIINVPINYFISQLFIVVSLSHLNYKYFELYFLNQRTS